MAPESTSTGHVPGVGAFVCVIGPASAGKTTIADTLSTAGETTVFRLRVFARDCGRAGLLPAHLDANDPLGDFPLDTTDHLLRLAFLHGRFPAPGGIVLFDDFPHRAEELGLLQSVARICGARILIVELDAAGVTLMTRAHHRRVCTSCEPDLDGDPHQQATPEQGLPDRCAVPACGRPLQVRRRDLPNAFLDRHEAYQQRRPDLLRAATDLHIPWIDIDTTATTAAVGTVRAAIRRFTGREASDMPRLPRPR
jgi:adenylate kinase family enzyme